MNKIFSKEIFLIIPLFLFTLFVSVNKVNADTITYTLPSNIERWVENNLPTLKSTADSFLQESSSDRIAYFIFCDYSRSTCYLDVITYQYGTNVVSMSYNNSFFVLNTSSGNFLRRVYNSGFTSLRNCGSGECPSPSITFPSNPRNANYMIPIYSSFDINITSDFKNNSYNYIISDKNITYVGSEQTKFSTINDIITDINNVPEDNYPLLTSFYSLCIDKFAFIVEEFTSNYIYLSIISILLLITFIYFLKRRFS